MTRGTIIGADHFTDAATKVVNYLNAHTPIPDWSVSRVAHGEQVHVHVHHEELLEVGDRVEWNESFCSRMAAGAAHVVRDSLLDPDYADLEKAKTIGAYAGFPIADDDGEMFGILCGVRTAPLAAEEPVDQDLLKLISELLSSQLALARTIDRERRGVEIAEAMAHTDALTGLLNRRGWDLIVEDAQQRIDAFGDDVAVAVVDLDGLKIINDVSGHAAGDELLRRAAQALLTAAHRGDRIARFGGDEFTILSNNVPPREIAAHFESFVSALRREGVEASIGYAAAQPGLVTMTDAFSLADAAMYVHKRSRRVA